jgi:FkbM family methyltransferase
MPWRSAFRVRAASSQLCFSVNHRDAIGRHIAKYGTHEPLLTRWLAEFLEISGPGIAIDIGANLGWHALHMAGHQNVDAVIAFEPDPSNFRLLKQNIAQNAIEKVIPDCRAVGATSGIARLYRYSRSNAGRHSIAVDHGRGSLQVPMTSLDEGLNDMGFSNRSIAIIKIDVEGYEPAVIAGAQQALCRADAVVLEYSPNWSHLGKPSAEDMLMSMQASGFTPFVMRSSGGTVRTSFDALRQFNGSLDVIFVRTERLAQLAPAMKEGHSSSLPLQAIAEENKRVKKPL